MGEWWIPVVALAAFTAWVLIGRWQERGDTPVSDEADDPSPYGGVPEEITRLADAERAAERAWTAGPR